MTLFNELREKYRSRVYWITGMYHMNDSLTEYTTFMKAKAIFW